MSQSILHIRNYLVEIKTITKRIETELKRIEERTDDRKLPSPYSFEGKPGHQQPDNLNSDVVNQPGDMERFVKYVKSGSVEPKALSHSALPDEVHAHITGHRVMHSISGNPGTSTTEFNLLQESGSIPLSVSYNTIRDYIIKSVDLGSTGFPNLIQDLTFKFNFSKFIYTETTLSQNSFFCTVVLDMLSAEATSSTKKGAKTAASKKFLEKLINEKFE